MKTPAKHNPWSLEKGALTELDLKRIMPERKKDKLDEMYDEQQSPDYKEPNWYMQENMRKRK